MDTKEEIPELTGGVGRLNLSIGRTILNRTVEQQTKTKKELQEDIQRFLGGKDLPFGRTVLPWDGISVSPPSH